MISGNRASFGFCHVVWTRPLLLGTGLRASVQNVTSRACSREMLLIHFHVSGCQHSHLFTPNLKLSINPCRHLYFKSHSISMNFFLSQSCGITSSQVLNTLLTQALIRFTKISLDYLTHASKP